MYFQTQLTDEVLGLPSLEDLGVKLNKVTDEMPWVLDPHRAFRYHTYYSLADRPVIHPLKPISGLEERAMERELYKGNKMLDLLQFSHPAIVSVILGTPIVLPLALLFVDLF